MKGKNFKCCSRKSWRYSSACTGVGSKSTEDEESVEGGVGFDDDWYEDGIGGTA